jgi:hypothetical protein
MCRCTRYMPNTSAGGVEGEGGAGRRQSGWQLAGSGSVSRLGARAGAGGVGECRRMRNAECGMGRTGRTGRTDQTADYGLRAVGCGLRAARNGVRGGERNGTRRADSGQAREEARGSEGRELGAPLRGGSWEPPRGAGTSADRPASSRQHAPREHAERGSREAVAPHAPNAPNAPNAMPAIVPALFARVASLELGTLQLQLLQRELGGIIILCYNPRSRTTREQHEQTSER